MGDARQFWPRPLVIGCRWAIWLGGAISLASAFLVTIDVLIRAIFRVSLLESFELGSYAFAISIALGLPYSFMAGAHIRINLAEKVKSRVFHAAADLVAIASMVSFAVLIAYFGFLTFLDSAKYGARSNSTLALPLAIPQGIWVAGLVVFAAVTLYALGRGLAWLTTAHSGTLLAAARLPDEDESVAAEADQ
jgi:TRAP-type C4-dicarboxylate transport system permease small subunit